MLAGREGGGGKGRDAARDRADADGIAVIEKADGAGGRDSRAGGRRESCGELRRDAEDRGIGGSLARVTVALSGVVELLSSTSTELAVVEAVGNRPEKASAAVRSGLPSALKSPVKSASGTPVVLNSAGDCSVPAPLLSMTATWATD